MKTHLPEVDNVMKEFLEKLIVLEEQNKLQFKKISNEIAIIEKFVLNDISGLSKSFIETVLSTIQAVEQFTAIEPDGYSFHAEIPDTVIEKAQHVVFDAYITLIKYYRNLSEDSGKKLDIGQIEKLVEVDVFPGNERYVVVCLYVSGVDTIEIDVTETGYNLYILQDPYRYEWYIKEGIVNRDTLFDTLYNVLTLLEFGKSD